MKRQVKQETRVDKIVRKNGRLKSTELSGRGRPKDMTGVPLACLPSDSQSRSGVKQRSFTEPAYRKSVNFFVPVVDKNQQPLMPTTLLRAKRWIESRKATPFWKKGVFCVRLNVKPSNNKKQDIVAGIDPGSKREAYTVKSQSHTFLNVLSETVDWVKDAVETRREMRRSRRNRKTPCRQNRKNRTRNPFPPSTKARWQLKLRICHWLKSMFPITHFIVEDIKARTTGKRRWDKSFSPLEVGKHWFYDELRKLGTLETKPGYETKELRDSLGLTKSGSKLADTFECHNVDSWVLANCLTGGHLKPDNVRLLKIVPLRFHRRQLHVFQPSKNGIRKSYGGTRSLGLKRGSLVKHRKHGFCFVGGTSKNRISVHSLETGKRLSRNIKTEDCRFKTFLSFRKEDIIISSPY